MKKSSIYACASAAAIAAALAFLLWQAGKASDVEYRIQKPVLSVERSLISRTSMTEEEVYPPLYSSINGGGITDAPEIPVKFFAGEQKTTRVNGVTVKASFPDDAKLRGIVDAALDEVTKSIPDDWYAQFNTLWIGNIVSFQAVYSPGVVTNEWGGSPVSYSPTEYNAALLTYSQNGERLRLSDLISKDDLLLELSADVAEKAHASRDFAFEVHAAPLAFGMDMSVSLKIAEIPSIFIYPSVSDNALHTKFKFNL